MKEIDLSALDDLEGGLIEVKALDSPRTFPAYISKTFLLIR